MVGFPEPIPYNRGDTTTRPQLRRQLHQFRHTIRQLASNTMSTTQQALFVGATQQRHQRLVGLGINNYLVTLPWLPCLTTGAQEQLAVEVLLSQQKIARVKARAIVQEHHNIPVKNIQLRGRAAWSANIKPYRLTIYPHTNRPHKPPQNHTDMHTGPAEQATPPQAKIIFFRCPKCPHQVTGTKPAFHHHNLDTRIWCNQCQRQRFVRLWQCSCGIPWHTCPNHRDEPARLRDQVPQLPRGPQATRAHNHKRVLGQGRDDHTHRWLDQPPPKRHKPEPREVELEVQPQSMTTRPKPHLMGPKLRAKFPRLELSAQPADLTAPPQLQPVVALHSGM